MNLPTRSSRNGTPSWVIPVVVVVLAALVAFLYVRRVPTDSPAATRNVAVTNCSRKINAQLQTAYKDRFVANDNLQIASNAGHVDPSLQKALIDADVALDNAVKAYNAGSDLAATNPDAFLASTVCQGGTT